MRYLLDTNVAGRFVDGTRGVRERAIAETRAGHRVGICHPVLGELCFGVENSASRDRNAAELRRARTSLIVWPYDEAAAEEYGRVAACLRQIGRPMQQIDIQVAAVALSLGDTVVVSVDTDLLAVPGLRVENWIVEPGRDIP